ncbi:MAG: WYL domain-containing protein [Actinobacteria bacterium]|nr:WYL domain-containing protein [Actinomycetota bacterium]
MFDEKGDLGELVEDRPTRGLGRVRSEHGIQLHLVDGGGDVVRGETQLDETGERLGDSLGPGGAILGEVVDRPDGSVTATLDVRNIDAFRSFVLSFLEHAEILEPADLRTDFVEWLEAQR